MINWGAVLITFAGAFELVSSVLNAIVRSTSFPLAIEVLGQFATWSQLIAIVLVPVALVVGFVPIAFGRRGLTSIAGDGIRAQLLVFSAPVASLLAGVLVIGVGFLSDASDEQQFENQISTELIIGVFAVLVALVAGIVVARAGIVRGFGRWSSFVAIALSGVSLALFSSASQPDWWDVPRAAGFVALGASWWRAGVPTDRRVTVGSKSLAE